jgi:hypothetical protein
MITKDSQAKLSDEHTEMRWFSLEDLKENKFSLTPSVIFYATNAIKESQK